jgi:HlyD family secretion protein
MWLKTITLVVGLLAVLGSVTTYISRVLTGDDTQAVMTHVVKRGELTVTVTENGTLESSNNKEIKCLVKGGSTVLWVIETGTLVKPGDELVKLDTSLIEENITRQQIAYERAVANQIIAQSDVDVAETNIEEYINGTYLEERSTIEKEIFDAQEVVKKAELAHSSVVRMAAKGLIRDLQLEGEKFAVDSAVKDLEMKKRKLETLDQYKKKKSMQQFKSTLEAAKAKLAAEEASLLLEKDRLDRDKEQLVNCIIKSDAAGLVIFPSAAEWKDTPDIEEGAAVREQQTLLMIPDLTKMQVKVGIHESKVHRIRVGMHATVRLQEETLEGEVDEIAEVTRPAGWWTGNMVKYDTTIKIQSRPGLKPGMSVVVDVVLGEHVDVLTIPVASIVQIGEQYLCWVKTAEGVNRRPIQLGDTNDEFTIVTAGLKEGDEVVLNPTAFVDDAQVVADQSTNNSAATTDS